MPSVRCATSRNSASWAMRAATGIAVAGERRRGRPCRPSARRTRRGRRARPRRGRAPRPATGPARRAGRSSRRPPCGRTPRSRGRPGPGAAAYRPSPSSRSMASTSATLNGSASVLGRLQRDVVAEPVRLLVRVGVAADVHQQRRVVDRRPGLPRRARPARRSAARSGTGAARAPSAARSRGRCPARARPRSSASRTALGACGSTVRAECRPTKMGQSPHDRCAGTASYGCSDQPTTEVDHDQDSDQRHRRGVTSTTGRSTTAGPSSTAATPSTSPPSARPSTWHRCSPRCPGGRCACPHWGQVAQGPGRRALRGPRRRDRGRRGVLHGARSRAGGRRRAPSS